MEQVPRAPPALASVKQCPGEDSVVLKCIFLITQWPACVWEHFQSDSPSLLSQVPLRNLPTHHHPLPPAPAHSHHSLRLVRMGSDHRVWSCTKPEDILTRTYLNLKGDGARMTSIHPVSPAPWSWEGLGWLEWGTEGGLLDGNPGGHRWALGNRAVLGFASAPSLHITARTLS